MPVDSFAQTDTLTVVLTDSVSLAHALSPTNDSERQLFRHLLENLVRVDCKGEVRPGLAQSWIRDETGLGWTFTLRQTARLPADSPVTPLHVVASLRSLLQAGQSSGLDSATVVDDRRLRVSLRESRDSTPRLLADPALAVMNGLASPGEPFRIIVPPRGSRPAVDFRIAANGDPRDALDHGADLLVTRDPALIDYVARRPEFSTLPLPWTQTYVLVEPGERGGELAEAVNAAPVRSSLARDAVRVDARASEPPYWWEDSPSCPADPPSIPAPRSPRIAYPAGDAVARDLAERVVALLPAGTGLRATALQPAEFSAALKAGTERGYIAPLPRQTLMPCRESAVWPAGVSIIPLIDTRAHAIVRRGSPPLTVDWDGTVRVDDIAETAGAQ